MMSRTHISMGIATTLLVTHPTTPRACFVGVIGGALGGIVCDIDAVKKDYQNDAHLGQYLGYGITAFVLLLDYFLQTGICIDILANMSSITYIGLFIYIALNVYGYFCKHRTFTHSILALVLMTISLASIHSGIAVAFAIGFVSHLILDLLNKKGLRLLFPLKKETCFNLCYANKLANTIFLIVGLVGSTFLLFNGLFMHVI